MTARATHEYHMCREGWKSRGSEGKEPSPLDNLKIQNPVASNITKKLEKVTEPCLGKILTRHATKV